LAPEGEYTVNRRYALFVALLAFGLLTSACMPGQRVEDDYTGTSSTPYIESLQTAPELRIKDLPIPAGYTYQPARSMIIEYGTVQAGIIAYEGTGPAGDLIAFFRREMPRFDWSLSTMIEREEIKMLFEKQGKICELTIRPSSGLSRRNVVSIYYAPKE
jgi:hypothetical protein